MSSQAQVVRIGKTAIVLVSVIVVLSLFYGTLLNIAGGSGGTQTKLVAGPGTGQFEDVPGDLALTDSTRAEATLGNALFFDGTAAVGLDHPGHLDTGPWTACTVAELDDQANQNGTFTAAAYANESILLQYDAGKWLAYYNNSTHDAKATLPAPNPTAETRVCARWNDSQLVVSRNTTISAGTSLSSAPASRNVSFDWQGTLDEVRTFNASVPDSDLQAFGSDAIQPLPGNDRQIRLMFDEGSGGTTQVFIAGGTVPIGNATWTNGVDQVPIDAGTDYELADAPLRIKLVSGGYLDGAPAVWVIRPSGGAFAGLLDIAANIGTAAISLVILGLLALGAASVLSGFDRF